MRIPYGFGKPYTIFIFGFLTLFLMIVTYLYRPPFGLISRRNRRRLNGLTDSVLELIPSNKKVTVPSALVPNGFKCSMSSFLKNKMSRSDTEPEPVDIFFIESTCSDNLTIRQACAIESACRNNPHSVVALKHLSAYLDETNAFLQILRKYKNFRSIMINPLKRTQHTVLRRWFLSGAWKPPPGQPLEYAAADLSDAFRWLELWIDGGLYLDLDTVTLKKIDDLKNVAGIQDDHTINVAVLQFQKNHSIVKAALDEYTRNWQGNYKSWGNKGPRLLTNILENKYNCINKPFNSTVCETVDFHVLPESAFYAVPYGKWKYFMIPDKYYEVVSDVEDSYVVHFWNKLSIAKQVDMGDGSFYDVLASEHCPLTYQEANLTLKVF